MDVLSHKLQEGLKHRLLKLNRQNYTEGGTWQLQMRHWWRKIEMKMLRNMAEHFTKKVYLYFLKFIFISTGFPQAFPSLQLHKSLYSLQFDLERSPKIWKAEIKKFYWPVEGCWSQSELFDEEDLFSPLSIITPSEH